MKEQKSIPIEFIERRIFFIRDQKVILDSDLASMYGVQTKVLNQAVKRNMERFPEDFMFRLTLEEVEQLKTQASISLPIIANRSQIVTGSQKHRDPHALPYVFTEHGTIMAANVLKSERAASVSVYVVRAFVKLREILGTHKDLVYKLEELERKLGTHDRQIQSIFEAIRQLMAPPEKPKRPIGFRVEEPKTIYRAKRRKG